MQKRQIKVSDLAMECLHVLEKYGYDKHTLWGNMYSDFFTVVRYYRASKTEMSNITRMLWLRAGLYDSDAVIADSEVN